jgi:hypothetical protein
MQLYTRLGYGLLHVLYTIVVTTYTLGKIIIYQELTLGWYLRIESAWPLSNFRSQKGDCKWLWIETTCDLKVAATPTANVEHFGRRLNFGFLCGVNASPTLLHVSKSTLGDDLTLGFRVVNTSPTLHVSKSTLGDYLTLGFRVVNASPTLLHVSKTPQQTIKKSAFPDFFWSGSFAKGIWQCTCMWLVEASTCRYDCPTTRFVTGNKQCTHWGKLCLDRGSLINWMHVKGRLS